MALCWDFKSKFRKNEETVTCKFGLSVVTTTC